MNPSEIAAAIRSGQSVADVATQLDCSASAVYQSLRRAGMSARSLEPDPDGVTYRRLKKYPGYRVGSDGSIQSCWSPRSGEKTETWRTLSIQRGRGTWFVSLGSSNDPSRTRPSVRGLYVAAFGEREGERIYEEVAKSQ